MFLFRWALMKLFAEVWWTVEVIILLEVWWLGIVVEHSDAQYFRWVVLMREAPPAKRRRDARDSPSSHRPYLLWRLPLAMVNQWILVLNFQRVPFPTNLKLLISFSLGPALWEMQKKRTFSPGPLLKYPALAHWFKRRPITLEVLKFYGALDTPFSHTNLCSWNASSEVWLLKGHHVV